MIICDMCGGTIPPENYKAQYPQVIDDDLCEECQARINAIYAEVQDYYKGVMRRKAAQRIDDLRDEYAQKNGLQLLLERRNAD